MAIDANGSADLDRPRGLVRPRRAPVGRVTFRARATGSVAEPRAELTLTSQNLAWQGLTNVSADASAHIDRAALEIGPVNVRLLGGTAAGRGRVVAGPGCPRERSGLVPPSIGVAWMSPRSSRRSA